MPACLPRCWGLPSPERPAAAGFCYGLLLTCSRRRFRLQFTQPVLPPMPSTHSFGIPRFHITCFRASAAGGQATVPPVRLTPAQPRHKITRGILRNSTAWRPSAPLSAQYRIFSFSSAGILTASYLVCFMLPANGAHWTLYRRCGGSGNRNHPMYPCSYLPRDSCLFALFWAFAAVGWVLLTPPVAYALALPSALLFWNCATAWAFPRWVLRRYAVLPTLPVTPVGGEMVPATVG